MRKIEKNIPVAKTISGVPRKYPELYKLKPGESVLFEDGRIRYAINAAKYRGYLPGKFVTRAVEGGVRVWRVK
jgi:hypothetical protein